MLSPHQKQSLLDAAIKLYEFAIGQETTTPCNACTHFYNGFCHKWEMDVPQEAQKAGCTEFIYNPDSVPF